MIGIPDNRLGEEMVAFIKLRSKKETKYDEKSLKDFLRTKVCFTF